MKNPTPPMNDFEFQAAHVAGKIDDFLRTMDADPLSPTWGCADLSYWRDKTAEFADARRQEAALPLALLYLRPYPGSRWQGHPRLLNAVEALIVYWVRMQYPDGSFDEWYKGERAYAAAAFTLFAMSRTIGLMQERLPAETVALARSAIARTARWLGPRSDLFKTNHQAVGAAAMAQASVLLNDPALAENALDKLRSIVATQTREGWFPEVGHMDVGYTFLTVEFAMTAVRTLGTRAYVESFTRAFDCACHFLHPDLSLGDEYGVCHNPYVSRIAAVLMSPYSGYAQRIRARLAHESCGHAGLSSTLADGLRFPRWAFQPLFAYDLHQETPMDGGASATPLPLEAGEAGLVHFAEADLTTGRAAWGAWVFARCAGGLTRVFNASGQTATHHGYAVRTHEGDFTNQTYKRLPTVSAVEGAALLQGRFPLAKVKKFFPALWMRLVLRLACSTALTSKLTRKGIDVIRKAKGTAVNQSSANLGASASIATLERAVTVTPRGIRIRDTLTLNEARPLADIHMMVSEGANPPTLHPLKEVLPSAPTPIQVLTLEHVYDASRDAITFHSTLQG